METNNGEDTGKSGTIGTVKIEWNLDFDNRWHEIKSIGQGDQKHTFGEEGRFRSKGRCKRCWGGLVGKVVAGDVPTAIRCRVCGILLEGDEARGRVPTDVQAEHVEHSKLGRWHSNEVSRRRKVREQDLSLYQPPDCEGISRTHKRSGAKGDQEGLADPERVSRGIGRVPVPASTNVDVRGRAAA